MTVRNEYKIDKKEIMSWAKTFYLYGKVNVILFGLWVFVFVCAVVELIILLCVGGDWTDWYLAVLLWVLSVYKLCFQRFLLQARRYKMLSKTYGVSEWMRSVDFTDEEIVLCDHTSVSKYRYESIKFIKDKKNAVLIVFNTGLGLILYKDAFVEGSWDECKAKIETIKQ